MQVPAWPVHPKIQTILNHYTSRKTNGLFAHEVAPTGLTTGQPCALLNWKKGKTYTYILLLILLLLFLLLWSSPSSDDILRQANQRSSDTESTSPRAQAPRSPPLPLLPSPPPTHSAFLVELQARLNGGSKCASPGQGPARRPLGRKASVPGNGKIDGTVLRETPRAPHGGFSANPQRPRGQARWYGQDIP